MSSKTLFALCFAYILSICYPQAINQQQTTMPVFKNVVLNSIGDIESVENPQKGHNGIISQEEYTKKQKMNDQQKQLINENIKFINQKLKKNVRVSLNEDVLIINQISQSKKPVQGSFSLKKSENTNYHTLNVSDLNLQKSQESSQQIPARDYQASLQRQSNPYLFCGRDMYQVKRKILPQSSLKSREILVQTSHGINMYIDSRDFLVSKTIMFSGTWQPNYINLIGHIVKPGDKVINLGSQTGLQALIMGHIIGQKGELFIFEPYSFSNKIVTKNVKINNLQKITKIYKYGAGDQKTKALIKIAYINTGASQIGSQYDPEIGYNQIQEVEIDTVDALIPKDVQLNFALIDVQRMEVKALKGMKQVISRSPNLVIMTEWQYNENINKQETLQLLNFMVQKGYKFYTYTGGDYVTCSLGQFTEHQTVEAFLKVQASDVFFFPKNFVLPK